LNRRAVRLFLLFAGAIILAHLLDPLAFRYVRVDNIHDEDWGRMLRVMGFVPLWLSGAIALALHERTRLRSLLRSSAGMLAIAPILGGIGAEAIKLVVRRLRPGELGEYVFRPFSERTFSTGGLGMASSHAMVAFAAAAILARIFPRTGWVWWALAWGCAFTRVAAGAHFLSDVAVAAVGGWLVAALALAAARAAHDARRGPRQRVHDEGEGAANHESCARCCGGVDT
jgi:membrane-associated phospholipid phosphatase